MSMLLSAQTGEVVTMGDLLGEDDGPDEDEMKAADAKIERIRAAKAARAAAARGQ